MTYKILLIEADSSDYDANLAVHECDSIDDLIASKLFMGFNFVNWLRTTKNEFVLKSFAQAGFCKVADVKKIDESIKFCDEIYTFHNDNSYKPPVMPQNLTEYDALSLVRNGVDIYYKVKPESILTGKVLKAYKNELEKQRVEDKKKKENQKRKNEKRKLTEIAKAKKLLKDAGEL